LGKDNDRHHVARDRVLRSLTQAVQDYVVVN